MREHCRHLMLAGLACLAGCVGASSDPTVTAPGVANAERALLSAIAETRTATAQLSGGPAAVAGAYIPEELQRPVDLSAKGDVAEVSRVLADRLHYGFSTNRTGATRPLPVTVTATAKPIVEVFRDLGKQAGKDADIIVDPSHKLITVTYHAKA